MSSHGSRKRPRSPNVVTPEGRGDTIEMRHECAVFTFGRFNPPHSGHAKLLEALAARPETDAYAFVTSTQNSKKNPLSVYQKVKYLQKMNPETAVRIINTTEADARTPARVIDKLAAAGYLPENITMLVGADRATDFDFLKPRGIKIETEESLDRADGMSATRMRNAATARNRDEFVKGTLIGAMTEENVDELMRNVRTGLKVGGSRRQRKTLKLPRRSRRNYI